MNIGHPQILKWVAQIWLWQQWLPGDIPHYIDGLVQERCNSSALEMELRISCTNPSISSLYGAGYSVKSKSMYACSEVEKNQRPPVPDG